MQCCDRHERSDNRLVGWRGGQGVDSFGRRLLIALFVVSRSAGNQRQSKPTVGNKERERVGRERKDGSWARDIAEVPLSALDKVLLLLWPCRWKSKIRSALGSIGASGCSGSRCFFAAINRQMITRAQLAFHVSLSSL